MWKNLMDWVEYRLPIMRVANMHAIQYPAPRNMNFWYMFGFLATIVLVNQIVTGIWLTMSYNPTAEGGHYYHLQNRYLCCTQPRLSSSLF